MIESIITIGKILFVLYVLFGIRKILKNQNTLNYNNALFHIETNKLIKEEIKKL